MGRKQSVRPGERAAALAELRDQKMASSAHAFVRGSTTRFYQWLEDSNRAALPEGPSAWICGDCHVGNLGPIADIDGNIAVQIRDLDQSVIGNPVHDLIRLALSLAMAARGSDLPGVTTTHIIERMMEGYERSFAPDDAAGMTNPAVMVPKIVKTLMREAAGRSWKHLADERIEGVAPAIPLGKRFWPMRVGERAAISSLFEVETTRTLVTSLRSRENDAEVRVLDAAYWCKGCSSLGGLRFAVLAAVGAGRQERHCLLDVKEAVATAAPHAISAVIPKDHGVRVVTGAINLSPFLGGRMMAARLLGKPVFIRELLPQDLKLEIERVSQIAAMEIAEYLAHVLGRAHARQLDERDRARWLTELRRNRSKMLDAPGWLWNSVVDLVAAHEAAYLNHCRRYAARPRSGG